MQLTKATVPCTLTGKEYIGGRAHLHNGAWNDRANCPKVGDQVTLDDVLSAHSLAGSLVEVGQR